MVLLDSFSFLDVCSRITVHSRNHAVHCFQMIGSKLSNFRFVKNVRLASNTSTRDALAANQLAGKDLEWTRYEAEVDKVKSWWKSPRWSGVERKYKPEDVVSLRGTENQTFPSNAAATKAYKLFRKLQTEGKTTATFGALDAVKVTQMAKYLPVRCTSMSRSLLCIISPSCCSYCFLAHAVVCCVFNLWCVKDRVCERLAILVNRLDDQRARPRLGRLPNGSVR